MLPIVPAGIFPDIYWWCSSTQRFFILLLLMIHNHYWPILDHDYPIINPWLSIIDHYCPITNNSRATSNGMASNGSYSPLLTQVFMAIIVVRKPSDCWCSKSRHRTSSFGARKNSCGCGWRAPEARSRRKVIPILHSCWNSYIQMISDGTRWNLTDLTNQHQHHSKCSSATSSTTSQLRRPQTRCLVIFWSMWIAG